MKAWFIEEGLEETIQAPKRDENGKLIPVSADKKKQNNKVIFLILSSIDSEQISNFDENETSSYVV